MFNYKLRWTLPHCYSLRYFSIILSNSSCGNVQWKEKKTHVLKTQYTFQKTWSSIHEYIFFLCLLYVPSYATPKVPNTPSYTTYSPVTPHTPQLRHMLPVTPLLWRKSQFQTSSALPQSSQVRRQMEKVTARRLIWGLFHLTFSNAISYC